MASDPNATTPAVGAARTTGQVGLPALILGVAWAFHLINWNAGQTAAVLALVAGATTYTQKLIEHRKGKALGGG